MAHGEDRRDKRKYCLDQCEGPGYDSHGGQSCGPDASFIALFQPFNKNGPGDSALFNGNSLPISPGNHKNI